MTYNPFDTSQTGPTNNRKWNYSDSQKPGYMTEITGTVVEMEVRPSVNYNTKEPEYWQSENPVNWDGKEYRNRPVTKSQLKMGELATPCTIFAVIVMGQSGRELEWVFSPRSLGQDALVQALGGDPDISHAMGKLLKISTPGMTANKAGGQVRVWNVQNLGEGDQTKVRGTKVSVPEPFMPGEAQPSPTQQPVVQTVQQPVVQPTPAVRPVSYDTGEITVYDEDIPF